MRAPSFLEIIRLGWSAVLAVTVLAIGGAYAYSAQETHVYRATATVFAYPAAKTSTSDYSSDLGLLSYGALSQTFASIARGRSTLRAAAARIGLPASDVARYTTRTALLPQTTVLEISVDGPRPATAISLANALATDVSTAAERYFHVISISRLDPAEPPAVLVVPRTGRNLLLGGIAGAIVGFVLAALALVLPDVGRLSSARRRPRPTPLPADPPVAAATSGDDAAPGARPGLDGV